MNVAELIAELRSYPLDSTVTNLSVAVKIGKRTSKLTYSERVAKRLGALK